MGEKDFLATKPRCLTDKNISIQQNSFSPKLFSSPTLNRSNPFHQDTEGHHMNFQGLFCLEKYFRAEKLKLQDF